MDYVIQTNTINLVDFGSGDAQISSGTDILANNMTLADTVTAPLTTEPDKITLYKATGGVYLTKKIMKSAVTSITVEYTPEQESDVVTISVKDALTTETLATRSTKGSNHMNKVVLNYEGRENNYLEIGTSGTELHLHNIYGNEYDGFKYIGFYGTSGPQGGILHEMIFDYTGGSIRYNSVEEIQPSGVITDDDITVGTGITIWQSGGDQFQFEDMFNQFVINEEGNERLWFNNHGTKMYFYIELKTPIPDITSFVYWTYGANDNYKFNDVSIYGTNKDPATMSDMHDVTTEWIKLTEPASVTQNLSIGTGVGQTISY